jgi:histidyl-tRNA synthetase
MEFAKGNTITINIIYGGYKMIQRPRGTIDVLPGESNKWIWLEKEIRNLANIFGYQEIRTPVFEHTELFERGVGGTTDIVEKEMYTFIDKGDRSITLKPEGTAPAARAYIEHKMQSLPQPIKMYYLTKIYRYERPQAGRLREHTQFGIEVFGSQNPQVDVEVITVAMGLFKKLGLKDLRLNINSIGCAECRKDYRRELMEYFKGKSNSLCTTCKSRIDRNPMRILDCKNPECKEIVNEAPVIIDYLCGECEEHFDKVKKLLMDIEIQFNINPMIVRGLDYYTKTVFEIVYDGLGAQSTVCGGGRYDGLTEEIGGAATPAVGFGMGLERLLLTLESQNLIPQNDTICEAFIAALGEKANEEGFMLMTKLRNLDISVQKDYLDKSLKGQLKLADKLNAKIVVILGDNELKDGKINIKNMDTGIQKEYEIENSLQVISDLLGRG